MMVQTLTRRSYLTLLGILFLLGLLSPLVHYLAPIPNAEQIAELGDQPGIEYVVTQMPLYAQYATTTALHVIPSFLFILLSLMQLSGKIRHRYPTLHRWNGRLFMLLGMSIGISGIALALLMPFAGITESIIIAPIGLFFLYALWRGYRHIRRGELAQHRRWMLFMVAVGYSPLTMRIINSVVEVNTDIAPQNIFAWAMLAATIINLAAVEWWMRKLAR